GGHYEFPAAETEQIVLAHDPVHPLMVGFPSAPVPFGGDPRPSIAGRLQRDSLDLVAQIQIRLYRRRGILPAVVPGPAHVRQSALAFQRNGRRQAHFFFEVWVDEPRVVNACSLRCSSTCCKHRCNKSISNAWRPTFRSSSATRPSSARRCPLPAKAWAP